MIITLIILILGIMAANRLQKTMDRPELPKNGLLYVVDCEFDFWRYLHNLDNDFFKAMRVSLNQIPDNAILPVYNDSPQAIDEKSFSAPSNAFGLFAGFGDIITIEGPSSLAGEDGSRPLIKVNFDPKDERFNSSIQRALEGPDVTVFRDGVFYNAKAIEGERLIDFVCSVVHSEDNLLKFNIDPLGKDEAKEPRHAILPFSQQGGYVIENYVAHPFTYQEVVLRMILDHYPDINFTWLDTVNASNELSSGEGGFKRAAGSDWLDALCKKIVLLHDEREEYRRSDEFRLSFLPKEKVEKAQKAAAAIARGIAKDFGEFQVFDPVGSSVKVVFDGMDERDGGIRIVTGDPWQPNGMSLVEALVAEPEKAAKAMKVLKEAKRQKHKGLFGKFFR